MQHTLHFPLLDSPESETGPQVFNVVIAYEDFETGKHAKRIYDVLTENLGAEWKVSNQMWKFDVLSIPKLREIAVKDALAADILMVSCHGERVPLHVKDWLETTIAMDHGPIALVALFDMRADASGSVRSYLADVARRGKMDFFAQPDEWPSVRRGGANWEHDPGFGDRTLTTLAGAVRRDIPVHWGINE